MLRKIYDNTNSASLATQARKKRFELFKNMVAAHERPLRILDVGGTEHFWRSMNFVQQPDIEITLLNVRRIETDLPNFISIQGDARDLAQFADKAFHIAFSNSVIEHVGGDADQRAMAEEMRRVAVSYFVQTPNRYFPIEPHYVFPFFQFLPVGVKVWLLCHFNLGWHKKSPDRASAESDARSIRLLGKRQFMTYFPEARLYEEKMLGLTKSFIAVCNQSAGKQPVQELGAAHL